jgi:hypothetical protein
LRIRELSQVFSFGGWGVWGASTGVEKILSFSRLCLMYQNRQHNSYVPDGRDVFTVTKICTKFKGSVVLEPVQQITV